LFAFLKDFFAFGTCIVSVTLASSVDTFFLDLNAQFTNLDSSEKPKQVVWIRIDFNANPELVLWIRFWVITERNTDPGSRIGVRIQGFDDQKW
jgi:hypothetical protein